MIDEHTSTPHHGIAPAAESDATPHSPSAPTSFWHLPYELRHLIILTACSSPGLPRHTTVGRSADCTTTMLALLQTARVFYPVIVPLLYSHVRLTRPSALKSFQQTLAARPSLGRLVKALHIGPDEPLPGDWLPIHQKRGHWLFTLNLGGLRKTSRCWVGSEEYEFDTDMRNSEEFDPKGRAVSQAFDAAACDLNVNLDPRNEGYDYSDRFLGMDPWVIRVMEVRAALELYYIELQHSAKSHGHTPAAYPSLKVTASSNTPAPANGGVIVDVSRADILDRLASPGAPTDSFSHPLVFARSGLPWAAFSSNCDLYEGDSIREDEADGAGGIPDVFSAPEAHISPTIDGPSDAVDNLRLGIWDPLNLSRPSTATVGGSLALASCLLSLAPHVRSLSLTGFFEKAVAGKRAPPHQALESVTLGPVAARWGVPLLLHHSALSGVQRLRVGGSILVKEETDCITGKDGALPQLSTVQWSMPEKCSDDNDEEVIQLVNELLGVDIRKLGERNTRADSERKRSRGSFEAKNGKTARPADAEQVETGQSAATQPRQLDVEVHLHPRDMAAIEDVAPTDEVWEAFENGTSLPGTRNRLKLKQHAEWVDYDDRTWADSAAMQALYDEGRAWWEDGL